MSDRVLVICYARGAEHPAPFEFLKDGDEVASAWFSDGLSVHEAKPLGEWLLRVARMYGRIHTEVNPLEAVKASMLEPNGRFDDDNVVAPGDEWGV